MMPKDSNVPNNNLLKVVTLSGDMIAVDISLSAVGKYDRRKPLERVLATPKRPGIIIGVGKRPTNHRHKEYLWVALDGDEGYVSYFDYVQAMAFNTGYYTRAHLDNYYHSAGELIESLLYQDGNYEQFVEVEKKIDEILKELEMRQHEIMISHGEFSGKTLRFAMTVVKDRYWSTNFKASQ